MAGLVVVAVAAPLTWSSQAAGDCLQDPSAADCAGYLYASAAHDVSSLCDSMPGMVGCELRAACGAETGGYCQPFSLLADICARDGMGGMGGCKNYKTLCGPHSQVGECASAAPIPHFVSTHTAHRSVAQMCSSMPTMSGCSACTNATCPAPLRSLSKVCKAMPKMHMCMPIEQMCADLSGTAALSRAFCTGLETKSHADPDPEFCTDGTVMYMNGFEMGFQSNTCPTVLLEAWTLNTEFKYALGLAGVVVLGFCSEALAYARRASAAGGCCAPAVGDSPTARRGLDSVLHVTQIGLGYCLMLVAMTYHVPLFACVLIGLGIGHCAFAHREVAGGAPAAVAGRPEPCCPDTTPILPVNAANSIQGGLETSMEAGLLANEHTAPSSSDGPAELTLQVGGMTCGACVKRVEGALRSVDAIASFTVSCHDTAAICVAFFQECQRYRCGQVALGPPGSARIVCAGGSGSSAVAAQAIQAIDDTGFSASLPGSE